MISYNCKKCGGDMNPSKALAQTFVGGMPDFEGDSHSSTFSAGGCGKMVECLKCEKCGWSTTPLKETTDMTHLEKEIADAMIEVNGGLSGHFGDMSRSAIKVMRKKLQEEMPDEIDILRAIKKSGARKHGDIARAVAGVYTLKEDLNDES